MAVSIGLIKTCRVEMPGAQPHRQSWPTLSLRAQDAAQYRDEHPESGQTTPATSVRFSQKCMPASA